MTVTPGTADAIEGQEIQLTATVLDENQNPLDGASVTWTSEDTAIVSVAADGTARARSTGRAEVRAAFRDVWGSATVTVSPGPEIVLSRDSIAFFAAVGGAAPEPQMFQVTNGGGGTLGGLSVEIAYASGEPAGWLDATLGSPTAPTTVTLSPVDEGIGQGTHTATVTVEADGAEDDPMALPVTLTIGGINVRESGEGTSVSESGSDDDVAVVLGARPASDVVLTVTSDDTGEVRVSPASIRFTPGNWDNPQTVSVEGVDDVLLDGDQVTDVTITVDRSASDASFREVPPAVVRVTTTDDDAPNIIIAQSGGGTSVNEDGSTDAFTVRLTARPLSTVTLDVESSDTGEATVAPTRLTFPPDDWDDPQTVTVTGIDDPMVDGDQTTTVTVSVDGADSDDAFDGAAAQTVTVRTIDDDVADLTIAESGGATTVTEEGGTDSFTVVLDVQPASNVELAVTSGDTDEAIVEPSTLTFTTGDWNQPKTVVVRGMDDDVDDGDQVTTVTISVNEDQSDASFRGVDDRTVQVTTLDDDGAGMTITESGGSTSVSESGSTDQFTVVLTSLVLTPVTLEIVSEDLSEATVSPATVTFDFVSWNQPRTITVTGVDDLLADGDQLTGITVSVASGSDASYASVSDQTVFVTTTDNDVAGFTIMESAGTSVSEGGGLDDFTVALTTEPMSDVVLSSASGDPTKLEARPETLTFTTGNWSAPQAVTLEAVDDDEVEDDAVITVTVSVVDASSDDAFHGVASQTVSVMVVDNDAAGFAVTQSGGSTVVSEAGVTDDLSVVLEARPATDVVLTVVSADPGEATASPASLTFTPAGWNVVQTVTVMATNDDELDGDQTTTLTVSVDDAQSDDTFGSLPDQGVSVTVIDDDDILRGSPVASSGAKPEAS